MSERIIPDLRTGRAPSREPLVITSCAANVSEAIGAAPGPGGRASKLPPVPLPDLLVELQHREVRPGAARSRRPERARPPIAGMPRHPSAVDRIAAYGRSPPTSRPRRLAARRPRAPGLGLLAWSRSLPAEPREVPGARLSQQRRPGTGSRPTDSVVSHHALRRLDHGRCPAPCSGTCMRGSGEAPRCSCSVRRRESWKTPPHVASHDHSRRLRAPGTPASHIRRQRHYPQFATKRISLWHRTEAPSRF